MGSIWKTPSRQELGNYLRTLRKSRGLTLLEVSSRATNLDAKSIERWETAQTLPQRDKLQSLLLALHASSIETEIAHRLAGVKILAQWQEAVGLWTPLPGELLRAARLERGWSEQDVAERIGVRAATVSHYENHRRLPNAPKSRQLEQLLGLHLEMEKPVLDGEDRDCLEKHINLIEKSITADPHHFPARSVLPSTMERLLLFSSHPPFDMEPLFRLWRLWAGWADSQGDFALVGKIGFRMVHQPVPVGADSYALRMERVRGRMYQVQAAMHQRHLITALETLEDASIHVPFGDPEETLALRIHIVRDQARLLMERGHFEPARRKAEDALRLAEQGNSQKIVDYCSLILARVLAADNTATVKTGDKALESLPALPPLLVSPTTRATYLMGYAQVKTSLGLWREATSFLDEAWKISKEHHLLYRLQQIESLARNQK